MARQAQSGAGQRDVTAGPRRYELPAGSRHAARAARRSWRVGRGLAENQTPLPGTRVLDVRHRAPARRHAAAPETVRPHRRPGLPDRRVVQGRELW